MPRPGLRGAQRVLLNYVREALSVPLLAPEVIREAADGLELEGGVQIVCYPCRPGGVRGIGAAAVVVDELAFFISSDGRPTDTEMLRAVRPLLAAGGRLLMLSSPYACSGALWDLHRRHYGRIDSPVRVWAASAPEMNPTLPPDYLMRMAEVRPRSLQVRGAWRVWKRHCAALRHRGPRCGG